MKEEFALQAIRRMFSAFDLDLWLQGHMCMVRHLVLSTHHKQLLFQIWIPAIKKWKSSLKSYDRFSICDLDVGLQGYFGDLKNSKWV